MAHPSFALPEQVRYDVSTLPDLGSHMEMRGVMSYT